MARASSTGISGEDEVIVTPERRLVLTGFGLTQLVFHPQTATPPEQLAGELCTPQGDLYAVGSLLRRLAFAGAICGAGAAGAAAVWAPGTLCSRCSPGRRP